MTASWQHSLLASRRRADFRRPEKVLGFLEEITAVTQLWTTVETVGPAIVEGTRR